MTTCAYPRCQAGGMILEGAPRVGAERHDDVEVFIDWYHPGCWAAERREGALDMALEVTAR